MKHQTPDYACHPERSEAESKDPAALPSSSATRFLDFARNDRRRRGRDEFDDWSFSGAWSLGFGCFLDYFR